jgi:hypothetical protein
MAFVDPWLIKPAMDAIAHGWSYGREARSIQFVKFERCSISLWTRSAGNTASAATAGGERLDRPVGHRAERCRGAELVRLLGDRPQA